MSDQIPGSPGEPGSVPPEPGSVPRGQPGPTTPAQPPLPPASGPPPPPPLPDEAPTEAFPNPVPVVPTPAVSTPAAPPPPAGGGNRIAIIIGGLILVVVIVVAAMLLGQNNGSSPSGTASVAPTEVVTEVPSATVEPTVEPTEVATEAPTATLTATPDACAPENLALLTGGTLTMGADNPAYPPYFEPSDPDPAPWELGDPANGKGFEGAVAAAIAREMGFSPETTTWVVTPFNNATQPGPKDFDLYLSQVSYSAERAQAVDLSDGYYDVAQSVVTLKGSPLASVTSIAGLKDFTYGAMVGTTSYQVIQDVIAPSKEARVYDTNDAAVEALKNGQIDGLVVDLPTAFFVTAVQVEEGVIVGQFAPTGDAEHFSAVLDKDSSLTPCVNAAIGRLGTSGELASITKEWLADKVSAPVFQP